MVPGPIGVAWTKSRFSAGWKIFRPHSEPRDFLFPLWRLWFMPRSLLDENISRRFNGMINDRPDFLSWWHESCGGEGERLFLLDFRDGAWNLPWELLVARLEEQRREYVSIARASSDSIPESPSISDESLRVLIGARARLIGGRTERMRPLDWATPVVWSASLPVPRLEWKAGSREWTQLQVLGRATLGASASSPADLVLPVRERERSRARAWGRMRRLWVQNDPTGADFRAEWIRYLQAVQSEYKTFVVAVDMTKGDVASSLSSWAEEVYSRLLPADLPSEIVGILSHLRIRPMDAWPKLCKLEGMYLAIAGPPGSDEEWFWKRCVERSLFGFGERSARLSGGRKRHGPPVGLVRSRGQAAR